LHFCPPDGGGGLPATEMSRLAVETVVFVGPLVLLVKVLALLALLVAARLLAAHAALTTTIRIGIPPLVILTALLALPVLSRLLATLTALTIPILLILILLIAVVVSVLHMKLLLHDTGNYLPVWTNKWGPP
jgi:hypothetical protein